MKLISYIRVSTKKQGRSGLGLEAQQEEISKYATSVNGEIVAQYKDVESGTHRDRKGLWQAIEHAKKIGATLVIAKLDRLARDVEFTFKVVNSGVQIHFCDMPVINTVTLGVFAAVAQYERELISQRTRAALAAQKAEKQALIDEGKIEEAEKIVCAGEKNNASSTIDAKRVNAIRVIQEKANERSKKFLNYVSLLHKQGLNLTQIANQLNEEGHTTAKGKQFQPTTIKRLLERIEQANKYTIPVKEECLIEA